MEADPIAVTAASILETDPRALSVMPLAGGANNRVFKITCNQEQYLLKQYYSRGADDWDRATTDFYFCDFAWKAGISSISEPIGILAKDHVALYKFIQGRRLTASEITSSAIDQAAEFFIQLNEHRFDAAAITLRTAAEACFSIEAHISCIERRLQKLISIEKHQYLGHEVKNFVDTQIVPTWNSLVEKIRAITTDELEKKEHCLSPSDFGFHNALLQADGTLRFFDFEYAGWDDPAKMICDFFCQPDLPVSRNHFENFAQRTTKDFPHAEKIIHRAEKLLPAYIIKWCCILLNEFLQHDASRRRFALTSISETERKEQQLVKAQKMLATLI